ncbi:MAG TPA: hypothetical protein DD706_06770, partial [Nitrospiraceae bacterium]|nr:hypothetical protein [Nitrospiraceae bacterium]
MSAWHGNSPDDLNSGVCDHTVVFNNPFGMKSFQGRLERVFLVMQNGMLLSCFPNFHRMGALFTWLAGQSLLVMLLGQPWCYGQESASDPALSRPWIIGQAAPFSQPIFTDRPTFSVGPGTIAQGHVQIETGYTFSFE